MSSVVLNPIDFHCTDKTRFKIFQDIFFCVPWTNKIIEVWFRTEPQSLANNALSKYDYQGEREIQHSSVGHEL